MEGGWAGRGRGGTNILCTTDQRVLILSLSGHSIDLYHPVAAWAWKTGEVWRVLLKHLLILMPNYQLWVVVSANRTLTNPTSVPKKIQ